MVRVSYSLLRQQNIATEQRSFPTRLTTKIFVSVSSLRLDLNGEVTGQHARTSNTLNLLNKTDMRKFAVQHITKEKIDKFIDALKEH